MKTMSPQGENVAVASVRRSLDGGGSPPDVSVRNLQWACRRKLHQADVLVIGTTHPSGTVAKKCSVPASLVLAERLSVRTDAFTKGCIGVQSRTDKNDCDRTRVHRP